MTIIAVTTSENYADFLNVVLPHNTQHFERCIVVTSPTDVSTKAVARNCGVELVETEAFSFNNAVFNKGRAINDTLSALDPGPDTWVLLLDGDILLPSDFREALKLQKLDRQCLYGALRAEYCIKDSAAATVEQHSKTFPGPFKDVIAGALIGQEFLRKRVPAASLNNGVAIPLANPLYWNSDSAGLLRQEGCFSGCYVPSGYFQLFNSSAVVLNGQLRYPVEFPDAAGSDLEFARLWMPENTRLLRNISVLHLQTSKIHGVNWQGRQSAVVQQLTVCVR